MDRNSSSEIEEEADQIRRVCSYCRSAITDPYKQKTYQCTSCGAVYHAVCWKQNGSQCSVYGCKGQAGFVFTYGAFQRIGMAVLTVVVIVQAILLYRMNKAHREELMSFQSRVKQLEGLVEKKHEAVYEDVFYQEAIVQLRQNHEATVRVLRQFGTAVESFAVDTNRYPKVSEVPDILVPTYIPSLPKTDAWKNPFNYHAWSEGTTSDENAQVYSLFSPGQDQIENTKDDYVFSRGAFEKLPELKDLVITKAALPAKP